MPPSCPGGGRKLILASGEILGGWRRELKVLVDRRHVGHHRLPVRPLQSDHFVDAQCRADAHRLGRLERQREIAPLYNNENSFIRHVLDLQRITLSTLSNVS